MPDQQRYVVRKKIIISEAHQVLVGVGVAIWHEVKPAKKLIPIYDVIKSVFVCKHLHFHTRVSLSLSLGENQCRKKSMILWKEKFNKIEALMWHI